nr:hypothetical protein [Klebsiella pneumoniae subsp. pneumoniae]
MGKNNDKAETLNTSGSPLAGGASSPACADPKYDFALHGYIRSGIWRTPMATARTPSA